MELLLPWRDLRLIDPLSRDQDIEATRTFERGTACNLERTSCGLVSTISRCPLQCCWDPFPGPAPAPALEAAGKRELLEDDRLAYGPSVERFLIIFVNILTTLWSFSFPGAI